MTRKQNLDRIDRSLRAEPVRGTNVTPAVSPIESDARQLAREAFQAFAEELEAYRTMGIAHVLNPHELSADEVESILALPPQDLTFSHLEHLSRVDPARACARWQEMNAVAREDLVNGRTAAFALEHVGGSAWERAMFVAVREQLYRAWSPRHAGEAMLLDEMAQYETIRQKWVCIISHWSRDPQIQHSLRNPDFMRKDKRDLNAAAANIEAMRMVERLQKLYQNALRTLLNSRRGKSPFIVQQATQMNIAVGPQLNPCTTTVDAPEET